MIEKFSLWVWGVVSMFIKASTNLGVLLLSCFLQPLLSCNVWGHLFGKAFSWLPAAKHGKGVLLAALHADVFFALFQKVTRLERLGHGI